NKKIKPMGKDTNFSGQPVFNQLLKLLTRQTIDKTALFVLTNRNNGATNADVLHRFCHFYGKS
ncbi:MAG: hypothetical protein LBS16_07375, partial [Prevotellaceae bacterium]|nr:hypothetical protein [Prevotellaceae bacterium]